MSRTRFAVVVAAVAILFTLIMNRQPADAQQPQARAQAWEYGVLTLDTRFDKTLTWAAPGKRLDAAGFEELGKLWPVPFKWESPASFLNAIGADGWELVTIDRDPRSTATNWTFKRPK